jgi:hypothetical protein
MRPLQRLLDSLGNEVCLFPMEYLHLSQGEHSLYALDFLGWNSLGRVYNCPCYAPFSGTVVYTGNDHNCILESDDLVHMPDGSLNYGRVLVAHSYNAPVLGTHYNQGDLFYITGNYGFSFGEHLHMEVASVVAKSIPYWNQGGIGIFGAIHMWDSLYVNDTVLLRPENYNWRTWDGPTPPTPTPTERKKHRFPWVLYERDFRDNKR